MKNLFLLAFIVVSFSANADVLTRCWDFAVDAANQEWYDSNGSMTGPEHADAVYEWNRLCEEEAR